MNKRAYRCTVVLILLLIGALVAGNMPEVLAQDTLLAEERTRDLLGKQMRAGIAAYEQEQWEAAERAFRTIVAEEAKFQLDGSSQTAIFWLGRVLEARDRSSQARVLWRASVQDGLDRQVLDLHAADAYVRSAFADEAQAHYDDATQLYLKIIDAADGPLSSGAKTIVERHLAQLRPLLPDTLQARIEEDGELSSAGHRMGQDIIAWLRSQDPRPVTSHNERVVEHLRRVAHATDAYSSEYDAAGFDDRGYVYVRYGAPSKKKEVGFHQRELMDRIHTLRRAMGNNLTVSPSSFPDNEFWLYERPEHSYYFLFVKEGSSYEAGEVMDLIPKHLQTGLDSSTGRGGAKIDVVLEALRVIYRQLATYHIDFGPRYARIDDYVGRLDEVRMRAEATNMEEFYTNDKRSDNSALAREHGLVRTMTNPPGRFARQTVTEAKREDQKNARRQQERVPRQTTNALADVESLPVVTRTARFLDEDGTTRAEVYWGLASDGAGELANILRREGQTLVDMTVRRLDEQYRGTGQSQEQYVLPAQVDDNVLVPEHPVALRGIEDSFHLAMEWNQYTLRREENGNVSADRHLRASVARSDSLRPLNSDPGVLEMSDVVPLVVVDESGLAAGSDDRFVGQPYPLSQIDSKMPLALYFEVYHLTYGPDERTRYTIDYQIERRTERGGLAGLFRGDDEQRTTTQTTREGASRRAEESLMIDLGDWNGEGLLRITVRVTDQASDQQVERSLDFVTDSKGAIPH